MTKVSRSFDAIIADLTSLADGQTDDLAGLLMEAAQAIGDLQRFIQPDSSEPRSTKVDATSTFVIAWLRREVAEGRLTKAQGERMGKRWSILGELAIQDGEFAIYVTKEAMMCGCGKGLLCPLNVQKKRTLRRIYQRGSK